MSVALLGAALTATAGGYLTNTNQNVAFLRNPAQDAAINLNGVYSNPAGVSFLKEGFHLGLNLQSAYQTREVTSKFAPFAYGANNNNSDTKLFKGTAYAPIIPSVQAAWVKDRWAFQFNFALVGGGGKAEFEQGMGSFESQVAMLGRVGQKLVGVGSGFDKYKVDAYMHGKQYVFGTTLGASFRVNDHFSVYGGLRGVYATAHYYGYLKNIQVNAGEGGSFKSASEHLKSAANKVEKYIEGKPELAPKLQPLVPLLNALPSKIQDVTLNADQHDFGFAPIVGAHFRSKYVDVAAKYEFRTAIAFKNESAKSESANNLSALAAYRDGAEVRSDIPALLTFGVQVRPVEGLRLNLGYHHYFDKQAKSGLKGAYRNELLNAGTKEYLFGAEYDLNKSWEVSAGVQRTEYPNTDAYMNDLSFTTNSTSLGLGVGYRVNDMVKVNVGYFHTFYDTFRKDSPNYNNVANIIAKSQSDNEKVQAGVVKQLVESGAVKGSDDFTRTNKVFGVGVELTF